ncbi:MAG: MerR family transcriptional regulator [Solirubrobacteraceae bacterium]|nr:MerR family transcriptional regulator [Solirubrobacteraceae bacterium]
MESEPDDLPVPQPLPLVPVPDEYRDALNPFQSGPEGNAGEVFRVGELSRRSGVAVGTIKFYLREGLLQPGEATAKTQALYNAEHLRRLRIIRVLSEVGTLSIAQIRSVVEVLEDEGTGVGEVSRAVSYALAATSFAAGPKRMRPVDDEPDDELAQARKLTDEFLDAIGLVADAESPARAQFAEAYAALQALGMNAHPIVFTEHARLAYELARFETGALKPRFTEHDRAAERRTIDEVVVGTVVFGAAFMALRAMAHEHEARRLLSAADQPQPTTHEP